MNPVAQLHGEQESGLAVQVAEYPHRFGWQMEYLWSLPDRDEGLIAFGWLELRDTAILNHVNMGLGPLYQL